MGSVDQLIYRDVELVMRIMRMRANRAIYIGKTFGDAEHVGVALHACRDSNDARNVGRPGARNHGIEFPGKIGKVEMTVVVDQHQLCALLSLST